MMKKLVALLMALALLCSSIGALAELTPADEAYHADHRTEPCSDAGNQALNKDATCKEAGLLRMWCYDCNRAYDHIIPKHTEHDNITHKTTKEPSCTETGIEYYRCAVCGESWTEDIGMVSHSLVADPGNSKPATALEDGVEAKKCENCTYTESKILPHLFDYEHQDKSLYDLSGTVPIPKDGPDNLDGIHKFGYALLANPAETEINCKAKNFVYFCTHCKQVVTVSRSKGEHQANDETTKTKISGGQCEDLVYEYKGCAVCGKDTTWTVTLKSDGHTYTEKDLVSEDPATCTTDGYKHYKCSVCGDPVDVKVADKLQHSWEKNPDQEPQNYLLPATCVADGKYSYAVVCDTCGEIMPGTEDAYKVETIKKLNHQEWLDNLQKTTKAFYIVNTDGTVEIGNGIDGVAIKVGESTYDEVDIGTGVYGKLKIVYTPAKCTTPGRITVTCVVDGCGAKIDKELSPLGHTPDMAWRPEAGEDGWDCTHAKSIAVRCVNYDECGCLVNVDIPAYAAHNFEDLCGYAQKRANGTLAKYYREGEYDEETDTWHGITLEDAFRNIALCSDYYEIWHCTNPWCDQQHLVEKKATKKHVVNTEKECTEIDSTCTEEGIRYYECVNCGFAQIEPIAPKDHLMINGRAIKDATCTEEGEREIYCSRCGETELDKDGRVVVLQSVAEKKGVQTKSIPTINHNWVHKEIEADCINGKEGTTYDICTMCHTKKNVVVFSGHQPVGTPIVTLKPTCTAPGKQDFKCAICHKNIEDDVIPPLGHSYQRYTTAEGENKVRDIEDVKELHEKAKGQECTDKCVAAKCETDAQHTLICDTCKEPLTWTEKDTAIGHHEMYKNGELTPSFTVLKVPTCDEAGKAVYKCLVCEKAVDYELAKLPHNLVPVYDFAKGVYRFVCDPLYNDQHGREELDKLLARAYDDEAIREAVRSRILRLTPEGAAFGTFGDEDHVIEAPVKKTEYTITAISDGRGKVELSDENMIPMNEAYVRITWRYTLSNKDTISFVTTREIRWTEEGDFGFKHVGTFKLTGLGVPEDAICNFIHVEVVSDPDADELFPGQYATYGVKDLK